MLSNLATFLLVALAVIWLLQVIAFMIAVLVYRRASPAPDRSEADESRTLRDAA